jgi:hypothetical protein
MNREMVRRILEDLRRGKKVSQTEYFRSLAHAWRVPCEHCEHQVQPFDLRHDFEALTASFECSLCGKRNLIPMKNFPVDPTATD